MNFLDRQVLKGVTIALWEQSGSKMPRAEAWIATEGPNITAQLLLS